MQLSGNEEKNISYCEGLVRAHDRDLYILALSVPQNQRENLLTLYALATELSYIRHMVSEEMIGHIRYAWWREALDKIYSGTTIPGHPVLEALLPLMPQLPKPKVMQLLDAYAEHYPQAPKGEWDAIEHLSIPLLSSEVIPAWKKTAKILSRHQARHGNKHKNWLLIKLLLASFF